MTGRCSLPCFLTCKLRSRGPQKSLRCSYCLHLRGHVPGSLLLSSLPFSNFLPKLHQGLFANHSSFVGESLWFLRDRCHWLVWLRCLWLYQKLSTLFGIQITSTMRQPSWSCPSVLSDTGSMSLGRFLPRATLSRNTYMHDFQILRTEQLRKHVV